MSTGLPPLSIWRWCLAIAPIAALAWLVARSRLPPALTSCLSLLLAVVLSIVAFGANAEVLAVATGKGVWTGIWILYVVIPALLLYHVARRAGLDDVGEQLETILPSKIENVLVVAWVFPSFMQGVAGFGAPIAVAAPLLVALGVSRAKAIALPLIGHHWAITFGSMGSSFYMGAFTADLGAGDFDSYATRAAATLAVQALLSGVLVALMFGGRDALREAGPMITIVGSVMAVTLMVAARIEPSIASVSAGAAGLASVAVLRRVGARSSGGPPDLRVLAPYAALLGLVLAVFLPEGSRRWVQKNVLLAPTFSGTETDFGFFNPPVGRFTPIAILGHPGTYVLVATLLGYVAYRRMRLWPGGGAKPVVAPWLAQSMKTALPVVALATLATIMSNTGMVGIIATGAANVTGDAYPLVAPLVGFIGSFTTGSSTNSNALFSALQRDVAILIDVPPAALVAAQTTGANIGNAMAPVVALVGASAIGARDQLGEVTRLVIRPVAALSASVIVMSAVSAAIGT